MNKIRETWGGEGNILWKDLVERKGKVLLTLAAFQEVAQVMGKVNKNERRYL
jgi:hypothetical protein